MRLGNREYRQFVGIAEVRLETIVIDYSRRDLNIFPRTVRSCAPAMIASSKCCPVSHRVLIVRVEHDHEARTRLFIFRLSDPGHIGNMPQIS